MEQTEKEITCYYYSGRIWCLLLGTILLTTAIIMLIQSPNLEKKRILFPLYRCEKLNLRSISDLEENTQLRAGMRFSPKLVWRQWPEIFPACLPLWALGGSLWPEQQRTTKNSEANTSHHWHCCRSNYPVKYILCWWFRGGEELPETKAEKGNVSYRPLVLIFWFKEGNYGMLQTVWTVCF